MTSVFVSYSHKDRAWKDRVVKHLNVPELDSGQGLRVWDDGRIAAGNDWFGDIRAAIEASQVAILLVSADFLTSKFVLGTEIPALLSRCAGEGLRIVPLIVHDCAWQRVSWLASLQARPLDGKALSLRSKAKAESALAELATEIVHVASAPAPRPSRADVPAAARPNREDAVRARARTEFEDLLRNPPIGSGLTPKIREIVERKYSPLSAQYDLVDARLEHELGPLVEGMIEIESRLRAKHQIPFTDESVAALRERIVQVISERWEPLVDMSNLDAENHVFHNLGMYPRYKEEELRKSANDLKASTDYRGLLGHVDKLLQRAYADSILDAGT